MYDRLLVQREEAELKKLRENKDIRAVNSAAWQESNTQFELVHGQHHALL